jgi:PTH1 family peptidyl-tRNA hydrolase
VAEGQDDSDEARQRVVVGLGNPGRRYRRTRHNVGFMVVERLAERWECPRPRKAFEGRLYEARPVRGGQDTRRALLFEPLTYVNRSGHAVRTLAGFYKLLARDVLVVLDDMALATGRLRARAQGSSGGHNGLEDILRAFGGDELPRLRIGIGSPPPRMDPRDYVLSRFSPDEEQAVARAVELAADAVEDWLFEDITNVMNKYNTREQGASDEAPDAED